VSESAEFEGLCEALIATVSKHTDNSTLAVSALAAISGKYVADYPEPGIALQAFMTVFGKAVEEFSSGQVKTSVVTDCKEHGANCPGDVVH
jgi:hypothetical protein